ncbi:alpha/beta hydrolase [Haloferula sp. BvORR071]|uniref:alpha/beta fold hydrolase n=1 Tax=Haloferula sp. BvORR071 TaxID=1396141 RepID=UPI00055756FF|nr:alpha/beta hydrolase [Haloferula sp. BvORR071]
MSAAAYRSPEARHKVIASYDAILAKWPIPFESRVLPLSQGETHLLVCGAADLPPLILLHGAGGNATMWFNIIQPLAKIRRVFAFDIPGDVGKSGGAPMDTKTEGYAAWLEECFVALGLQRADVCGVSFGAWLGSRFALKHPGKVGALIMLAGPHLLPVKPGFIFRAIIASAIPTEGRIRAFYAHLSSPRGKRPPEEAMRDFILRWRSQQRTPPPVPMITDEELSRLPQRTLLILGKDEALFDPERAAERVRKAASQVRVELIADAGHVLTIDQAETVMKRVLEFLEQG